jgi:hypothetical protein
MTDDCEYPADTGDPGQLEAYLSQLSGMLELLHQDGELLGQLLPPGDLRRRTLIRAALAEIEATLHLVRQTGRIMFQMGFSDMNALELAILLEEDHYMDRGGELKTRNRFLEPFKAGVKFTLATLARTTTDGYEPAFSDNGWRQFQLAVDIRNRLMHPKSLSDCHVSDDEFTDAGGGVRWVISTVLALHNAMAVRMMRLGSRPSEEPTR